LWKAEPAGAEEDIPAGEAPYLGAGVLRLEAERLPFACFKGFTFPEITGDVRSAVRFK
jgi:hypothetical protein